MIYRHGDILIVATDQIPEGLKIKQDNVLLEGETTGHMHRLNEKAKVWNTLVAPSRDNDYLIGYFQTEEGALLTHQEHQTIELPKGTYKFYAQREYDEQEERQVID